MHIIEYKFVRTFMKIKFDESLLWLLIFVKEQWLSLYFLSITYMYSALLIYYYMIRFQLLYELELKEKNIIRQCGNLQIL